MLEKVGNRNYRFRGRKPGKSIVQEAPKPDDLILKEAKKDPELVEFLLHVKKWDLRERAARLIKIRQAKAS